METFVFVSSSHFQPKTTTIPTRDYSFSNMRKSLVTLLDQRTLHNLSSTRYFARSLDVWFRAQPRNHDDQPNSWNVQVGLTEKGLERIGDITRITSVTNTNVATGQELLKIDWEGYTRTEADELYHAVWDSIEGHHIIHSPVNGKLFATADLEQEGEIDEGTVLAQVQCSDDDLHFAAKTWVTWNEYSAKSKESGPFADTVPLNHM